MIGKIRKWGNGLGIRVPKSVAKKLNLKLADPVKFEALANTPTFPRRRRGKYKLSELLAGYNGPYPYRRVIDDPPIGRELI